MRRPLAIALFAALLVGMGVAALLRAWGAFALAGLLAGGMAWYRIQVRRTEAGEQFFDGLGEETRLTSMQGGSPSELAAADARDAEGASAPTAPPSGTEPR